MMIYSKTPHICSKNSYVYIYIHMSSLNTVTFSLATNRADKNCGGGKQMKERFFIQLNNFLLMSADQKAER